MSCTDKQIELINQYLELSIDQDILLEVVYTAFNDKRNRDDIVKAFEKSLWHWLVFNAKKPAKKLDLNKLKLIIDTIKNAR